MRKDIYKLIWYIVFINSTCGFVISPSGKHIQTNKIESNGAKTTPLPTSFAPTTSKSTKAENAGKVKDTPIVFKKCPPCKPGIKCVPSIQCPAHVRMHGDDHPQLCDLPGSPTTRGLCCTTGYNHTEAIVPHLRQKSEDRDRTVFMQYQMKNVLEKAELELKKVLKIERSHQGHVYRGHPDFLHHQMFRPRTASDVAKAIRASHRAMEHMFASKIFKRKEDISNEKFQLRQFDTEFQSNDLFCEPPISCPASSERYRSADGRCNNIEPQQGHWGAVDTPMERLLPPVYADGVWAPRATASDGVSRLTNARIISRLLFEDVNRPHSMYNLLVMQFGQFISHDVTKSASITSSDGSPIQCCTEDGSQELPKASQHFGCFPILIDAEDSFYRNFNQGCMNFVRSTLATDPECRFGYGKQISKVTHYLDGSVIYGSDDKTMSDVRSFQGGQLRMLDDFGRQLLPLTHLKDACVLMDKGNFCFLAGDIRVNQIISLVSLHTVFAREHNRIASILNQLNPHWTDEILFQETRRIVVAEYQHIIFNEWLPIIVGEEAMNRFDLYSRPAGEYGNSYSQFVNPSITNEFSGAAFRFGHSTVDGKFNIHNEGQLDEVVNIPDVMFKPSRIRQAHFYDELLKTMTRQPMQEVDNSITNGLSKFLFRGGQPFGLDLVSMNIQRGRDHALRPYNDYLEVTGRARIADFNEFDFDVAQKLQSVYRSPDDIDLWVGGLLESATDGIVGPTFGDIIADQFSKFKRGDRFFYEFSPEINPGHFEIQQLDEIRKASIARIICDNSDHFSLFKMSPNAFELPLSNGQNFIDCNSEEIPFIDLNQWRT